VSESIPYVMGSVVAVRIYGAKLGRAARREHGEADPADERAAFPRGSEEADPPTS
jgi:hypothetical protein